MTRTIRSERAERNRFGNARMVVRKRKLIDRRAERRRRNTQAMKEIKHVSSD